MLLMDMFSELYIYWLDTLHMYSTLLYILSSASVERMDSGRGGGVMDLPVCLHRDTMSLKLHVCVLASILTGYCN